MRTPPNVAALLAALATLTSVQAQETRINVQADQVVHPVSRLLTGACIEDVNHEIYGGIYSQMIFGESFQEPPAAIAVPIKGFKAFGGHWRGHGEELQVSGSPGDRLVSELPAFTDGEVGVEVFVPDRNCPNAGLVVRVAKPGVGVDNFDGYEIALNAAEQNVRLGRHRHDWEPIKDTPCEVPVGQWVRLAVELTGQTIEVFVNGKSIIRHQDGNETLLAGTIGLRQFEPEARYRKLWVKTGGETRMLPFDSGSDAPLEVSGMWQAVRRGAAAGAFTLERDHPFVGQQSQRLTFSQGQGEIGVGNEGLNRRGMYFKEGKTYEGVLWARADSPVDLFVALESPDSPQALAEERLSVKAGDWQRLTFTLRPRRTEKSGRFAITLRKPGSVLLGYALLEPGEWGRFKGLPVRRDVAEELVAQGITVLRYGGSMVNHPSYKWKHMIGPRDRRPPYSGTWYRYSSNGWGIPEFMAFCEAAGFDYIPAFNLGETPQDMADFIEYAEGPAGSVWGGRRVADGHPQPYHLRYLELGNEERVDENYADKFEALAKAIWAKDKDVILVVGDFVYAKRIQDPFNFDGAPSGITTLAAQQRILRLAKQHNREVWFDLHVGTDGPRPDATLAGVFSFIDALDRIADGARFKVAVFEFNAGNHAQRRALANALAIQAIERDGRLPVATSANCLQPDGQNDNGWDQGLLFLNPSQVWLQPPGYVTRMLSRNYQPRLVRCDVEAPEGGFDVVATRSEDGKTLVLQVVNVGETAAAVIRLGGFKPSESTAAVEELAGPLEATNTADNPTRITPCYEAWPHGFTNGSVRRVFPAHSFSVIVFK